LFVAAADAADAARVHADLAPLQARGVQLLVTRSGPPAADPPQPRNG
jgi:hypothetical protein